MKRNSKIYAVIMALVASLLMALPVSAAEAGKEVPAVSLVTAAKKVNVSKCKITVAKTVSFTGKAVKPKVTVKYGKKKLKSGKHYKLTYSSNKKIGTAKIKITGVSKGGYTGSKTVSFKIVPKKPVISVKNSTSSTVNLSWKKVSGAKNYIVYRYDSAKKKYVKLGTTSNTTYTAKNLASAKKYTFAVKAFAKKNFLSDYSAKKSIYTCPAAVENISATASTDSAVLTWDKVDGATGYVVYEIEDGKYIKKSTTKSLNYTVSDLAEDTDYTYAVAAYVNKTSYLGVKTDVEFTTSSSAPALGKVENLVVKNENEKAVLTWDKVEGAEGYTVYLYDTVSGEYTELDTFEGRETYSYQITEGLYTFTVAPYYTENNESIYGDYSDTASVGVPCKAVENLHAYSLSAPAVSLSWDIKEGAEGYDVYSYNAETNEYTFLFDAGSASTAEIKDVESQKIYTYVVNAYYYADGQKISGEYSLPASANTAFGENITIKATALSDTEITLKWNLIEGSTSYNVYKMDDETGNYVLVDNTTNSSYAIKNLSEDTTYKFAVSAVRELDDNYFESFKSESSDVYFTKTMPSKLKASYDTFKSGNFGIRYELTLDDGSVTPVETYAKNGNFALVTQMDIEGIKMEAKILYLKDKNKGYTLVSTSLGNFYMEMTEAEINSEGNNISEIVSEMAPEFNEKIPFTVEVKEYEGQTVTCEGLVDNNGKIISYYYNSNGDLIAIEEIAKNGSSTIMKVSNFSSSVDDKIFKLPTAFPFGWIDLSTMDK